MNELQDIINEMVGVYNFNSEDIQNFHSNVNVTAEYLSDAMGLPQKDYSNRGKVLKFLYIQTGNTILDQCFENTLKDKDYRACINIIPDDERASTAIELYDILAPPSLEMYVANNGKLGSNVLELGDKNGF